MICHCRHKFGWRLLRYMLLFCRLHLYDPMQMQGLKGITSNTVIFLRLEVDRVLS